MQSPDRSYLNRSCKKPPNPDKETDSDIDYSTEESEFIMTGSEEHSATALSNEGGGDNLSQSTKDHAQVIHNWHNPTREVVYIPPPTAHINQIREIEFVKEVAKNSLDKKEYFHDLFYKDISKEDLGVGEIEIDKKRNDHHYYQGFTGISRTFKSYK
jgi:hypothetical protein